MITGLLWMRENGQPFWKNGQNPSERSWNGAFTRDKGSLREEKKMDTLLIRNGTVVNAEDGTMVQADILAEGSRIPEGRAGDPRPGGQRDQCDRLLCDSGTGGPPYPYLSHGVHRGSLERPVCFGSGVTTAVDAGSTGCGTYERYRPWIRASKLAVCPYIHVSTGGLSSLPEAMEDVDPHHMDAEGIRELFRRYGNELAGLKIRISRNIVGDLGMDPLKRAVEIAELTGVPLMVHITDPPAPIEEVLSVLRPGDIVTHMYQNTGPTILDRGAVSDAVKAAREKGILFEAGGCPGPLFLRGSGAGHRRGILSRSSGN